MLQHFRFSFTFFFLLDTEKRMSAANKRTSRSLFELDSTKFVESLVGVTNGKEGLAQMMMAREAEDKAKADGQKQAPQEPQEQKAQPQSEGKMEGQQVQVQVQAQDEEQRQGGQTCRTCAISFERSALSPFFFLSSSFLSSDDLFFGFGFGSVEEQREHFKLDWHRCNLKRKIEKKAPLSEVDFEKMLDDAGLLSSFFLSFLSFF